MEPNDIAAVRGPESFANRNTQCRVPHQIFPTPLMTSSTGLSTRARWIASRSDKGIFAFAHCSIFSSFARGGDDNCETTETYSLSTACGSPEWAVLDYHGHGES